MTLFRLARASALYTIANILPKVGAVFLVPVYVRFLTSAEYGTLALVSTLVGLLTTLYRLGMDGSLMRLHFDTEGRSRGSLYSTIALFTLGLAAVVTGILAILGISVLRDPILGIAFWPVGLIAILIALTNSIGFVPSVIFRATQQASKFAVFSIGGFLLTAGLVVALLVLARQGLVGALVGQLLAGALILVVALVITVRTGGISFNVAQLRASLSFGLPLVPHALSAWALKLMDRWLIAIFIGLSPTMTLAAIGAYSLGYQIGSIVTIVLTSFNSAWSPYFFSVGDEESGPRLHREMTTIVMLGLLALGVGIAALSVEAIELIARRGYEGAAAVIPVVVLGSLLQALYTMFVTVVFHTKRTRRIALLTFASALVNLVLNVLLIPPLGILGAAWATVGGYAFFALGTYLYARRIYPLQVDAVRIGLAMALGAAVVIGARLVQPGDLLQAATLHTAMALAYAAVMLALAWRSVKALAALTRVRGPRAKPA
jgi:O-antigen/teichoic acid export membrane protein